jgi:hypothetical protein
MESQKTFEEQVIELKEVRKPADLNNNLISLESINQLIKGHELKYIEKVLEVSEEERMALENIEDFLAYPVEVQEKALAEFPKSQRDEGYFTREGADINLAKPFLILSNIENKKNEVKTKNWHVEYHGRLIAKLCEFRDNYPVETNAI